jgi:hypothetical protein
MGNVVRLSSPSPASAPQWPIAGDAPDLLAIAQDQAQTIAAQMALAEAYQAWLNTEQAPPATPASAQGNGTASGVPATTLTVSGVTGGSIAVPVTTIPTSPGATVFGAGVPAGTQIMSQTSGTAGGNGVYVTNNATTASATPLIFVPPAPHSQWPVPRDAPTLNTIVQDQTALIRTLTALIQQYQQVLNDSQTQSPPTGP